MHILGCEDVVFQVGEKLFLKTIHADHNTVLACTAVAILGAAIFSLCTLTVTGHDHYLGPTFTANQEAAEEVLTD